MPFRQIPHSISMANRLALETSPYLLQHANNPVNWYPWGDEALARAKDENKLLLISIGYSSCHWCHVMEHESFENEEVAAAMNADFVCIKIDREERPDIDAVYMEAVQMIAGRGGWPLNCFTLPDGRPIYGGTYFPKTNWLELLKELADVWKFEKEKAIDYAEKLTQGLEQKSILDLPSDLPDLNAILKSSIATWKLRLDNVEGGPAKAPKFPLPGDYVFLLRQAIATQDDNLLQHVYLTLKKMAYGGIYDQTGGGFARYSTDGLWKVPHFEKMLYDNAQLISLYSEAYIQSRNPLYKEVVDETIGWLKREMLTPEGSFYSALDADSDGVEGKFYVWEKAELQALLGNDYDVMADYININEYGFWEENYILLRMEDDETIAQKHNLTLAELKTKVAHTKTLLLKEREKRNRPGLDDKQLLSWNALTCMGLCKAYEATLNPEYKALAIRNMEFILQKMQASDGTLHRTYKNGKASISAFLDDYAFAVSALLQVYQITFDEGYVIKALNVLKTINERFTNPDGPLYFYVSATDKQLIVRRTEYMDNVTPAANSELAKALFLLSRLTGNMEFETRSKKMLTAIAPAIINYASAFSNWCQLAQWLNYGFSETVITGQNSAKCWAELSAKYEPFTLKVTASKSSSLAIFEGKKHSDDTLIYVCQNQSCGLPVKY